MALTRAIAQNTSIQIAGKIVSTLLGLLAVIIMTRGLELEQFGWYSTTVGFLQFVGILSDFGFMVTTANMLAEPNFEKNKLLNTLFTWRFFTALLFHGLAPIAILFFPYPREIKIAVGIVTISFFAAAMNQLFTGYYQANLKTYRVAWGELLGRIILVIGTLVAVFWRGGFYGAMAAITLASIINACYLIKHIPSLKFSFDKAISRAIFIKIWPNSLSVIFNSFYLQGDRVLLPLYVDQSSVALYGAAYRVLDIIIQIAAIIMGIMMPLLTYAWSRKLAKDFLERYRLSIIMVSALLFPILIGMIALSTPLMEFVGGAKYASAGSILQWLSWAILGIVFGMVFGYSALAIGKQKQAVWIYASDAVLSVIGYLIFIPRYGIYGAAGVTIFSEIYAGLLLFILVFYYTKISPPWLTIVKIIFASLLMGLLIHYLAFLPLISLILIGASAYSSIIIFFGVIKKETLKEVFRSSP